MTLNERYQVHERVGEGGMALVYHATDLRLSRPVAVKGSRRTRLSVLRAISERPTSSG